MNQLIVSISIFVILIFASLFLFWAGYKMVQPSPRATSPDRLISVYGSNIRYQSNGAGTTAIVFLHGFAGSLGEWHQIAPRVSYNRTVALDLVGFAGSARPVISYDLATQAKYVEEFLVQVGVNRAVLVGRSMGGSIAVWVASQATRVEIAGLVLIAPSGFPNSLKYPWPLGPFYKPGILNRTLAIVLENRVFRWLFPESIAPQAIAVTNSYNESFAALLKTIREPTLLLWSPGDRTVPIRFSQEYRSRIEDVTFIELPSHVGHAVFREYADQTAAHINQFIATQ